MRRGVFAVLTVVVLLPFVALAEENAPPPPVGPPPESVTPKAGGHEPIPAAPKPWPKVGGHFGLACPLVSFNNDGVAAIGRDFVQVGVTPGITVKLSEHWSIDFEFIAFSRWEFGKDGAPNVSRTIFVVDPGVVYNFGRVAAGLRLAVQIGQPVNFGIVPIVVVPFQIGKKLSFFLELDLPVFVFFHAAVPATATTAEIPQRAVGDLTILPQFGFAF